MGHGEKEVRLQALQRVPLPDVKLEKGPAASVNEIKSAYTLSARSLVNHLLKGDKAAGLHIVGEEPSEAPTEGQLA